MPLIAIFAYEKGYRCGKGLEEPKKTVKRPLLRRKKPKMSEKTRKLNTYLGNVDVYDGTSAGQKEI